MTNNEHANQMAKEIVENSPNKMLRELATDLGMSLADVERYVKAQAYRKSYNQRADVQAKRRLYNQERAEKMKLVRDRIKQSDRLTTLNRLAEGMVEK